MRTWIWMTLLSLSLTTAACLETTSNAEPNCGQGDVGYYDDEAYCVFSEDLIIEGFMCPEGLAQHSIPGGVVCGGGSGPLPEPVAGFFERSLQSTQDPPLPPNDPCAGVFCPQGSTCSEGSCISSSTPGGPAGRCDDGNPVTCNIGVESCPNGLIPANIGGCTTCVDPVSCQDPKCDEDAQEVCDFSRASLQCADGQISALRNGCFECVDPNTCMPEPPSGTTCDDGSAPGVCDAVEIVCSGNTIEALIEGCPVCVDPETCMPPSPVPCSDNNEVLCDLDPSSLSCPEGQVVGAYQGCYECVNPNTCQPPADDEVCDDGKPTLCDGLRNPNSCAQGQINAAINGCFVCVDAQTCLPAPDVCNDGMPISCDLDPNTLQCQGNDIVAEINGCYECVDPFTCQTR